MSMSSSVTHGVSEKALRRMRWAGGAVIVAMILAAIYGLTHPNQKNAAKQMPAPQSSSAFEYLSDG